MNGSRSVALVVAIYRLTLLLYPRGFRRSFARQAVDDFSALASEARARGVVSVGVLLLRALADVVATAPRERLEALRHPTTGPRRGTAITGLGHDVRFALRQLSRSPGFALVAVLTVALGVGANTALFSVVHGVLLERLPFGEPERLMRLSHQDLGGGTVFEGDVTPGNFTVWQETSTAFDSMAAYTGSSVTMTGSGGAERLVGLFSLGSVFDVLGTPARLGRTFTSAEEVPDGERVVVLSDALWRRLGADEDVVGATLQLGGHPFTVIGVMPPEFVFPDAAVDFWAPARWGAEFRRNHTEYFLRVIGRLAPGVTEVQARAEMDGVAAALREAQPQANEDVGVAVVRFHDAMVADVQTRIFVLMGAVAFVLLVACANLAHLLMARASRRREEMALRLSLGASRSRLLRQVLTESLLLAALGGVAGAGLGWLFLQALLRFLPAELPRMESVGFDLPVLAFTAAATLLAGLVFGCFPAIQVATEAAAELPRGGRSTRRGGWARWALVVAQVAFSVVLVAGALLLLRSFLALEEVDPGVPTDGVLTFRLALGSSDLEPDYPATMQDLATALEALPGVGAAGFASSLPVTGTGAGAWVNLMARPLPDGQQPPIARYRVVTPGYADAIGLRALTGRWLDDRDGREESPGVVVNETAVRELFPDGEALGQQLTLGPDGGWIPPSTVVGVVRDVRNLALSLPAPPVVYLPHGLVPWWSRMSAAVRVEGDPLAAAPDVRRLVRERDPEAIVWDVEPFDVLLARDLAPTRSTALLLGLFAAVAMTIAAVGVFGILSLAVAERVRELGIRLVLGADATSLRWTVVRESVLQALVGAALGLAGAIAVGRTLESLLYGVEPDDLLALAGAALLLPLVAAVAAYLPARRASTVDPAEVLRA